MIAKIFGALAVVATTAAGAVGPTSLNAGTIAELTWPEFAQEAETGSIALWAIGSIEQHGPHLPLATDVIIPSHLLGDVRERLSKQGRRAIVLPPYIWGVNAVTGSFPGSIEVQPETMAALLVDVLRSMSKAGFKRTYLITGHYDAAHNFAIAAAIRRARREGIEATFVIPSTLARRLEISQEEPGFAVANFPLPASAKPDLHAGAVETSMMLSAAPDSVRKTIMATLPETQLSEADIARWRLGQDHARKLTPKGYVGAPAAATAEAGSKRLNMEAAAYAQAILAEEARSKPDTEVHEGQTKTPSPAEKVSP